MKQTTKPKRAEKAPTRRQKTNWSELIQYLFCIFVVCCGLWLASVPLFARAIIPDVLALVLPDYFKVAACISGVAIMAVGMWGLCTTLVARCGMMSVFAVLMTLTLCAALTVSALALHKAYVAEKAVGQAFHDAIALQRKQPGATAIIDRLQVGMKCCGLTFYKDWQQGGYVPRSCCGNINVGRECDDKFVFKSGCRDKMLAALRKSLVSVAAIATAFSFFIYCGLLVNCYLCQRAKEIDALR